MPTFSPISPTITGTVGTALSVPLVTFTADVSDFAGATVTSIGLVTISGGATYLKNNDTVFCGATLYAPGSVNGTSTTDTSIHLQGTPTVVGSYTVYVRLNWFYPEDPLGHTSKTTFHTYTVNVGCPNSLTVVPAASVGSPPTITPAGTNGSIYVSNAFTIKYGSGPYTIVLTGAPATIGLSATPSYSGTVVTTLNIPGNGCAADTPYYVVGLPGAAFSGTIVTQITDNSTGLIYAGNGYTLVVNNAAGGTLPVTEVGGSRSLPNPNQVEPFSVQYTTSGGTAPYTWSLGSSIAGLSIGASTGVLSGTPTGYGVVSSTVVVNDSACHTGSLGVTFTIAPFANYTGTWRSTGTVGTLYEALLSDDSNTLTAIGGDGTAGNYKWHVQTINPDLTTSPNMPAGLSIRQGGTVVSGFTVVSGLYFTLVGTPTAAVPTGTYINVIPYAPVGLSLYPGNAVKLPLTITGVNALLISPATLVPDWAQNISSAIALSVIDGTTPYSWVVGTLPSGFTSSFVGPNNSTGSISGGSTVYGTYNIPVSVSDSSGPIKTGAINYTLTVDPNIWITSGLSGGDLPAGVRGSAYSQTIVFAGGNGTFTSISVDTSTLPSGISTSIGGAGNSNLIFSTGSGTISGSAATYNVSITATVQTPGASSGASYTKIFSLPLVISGSSTGSLVPFAPTLCTNAGIVFPSFPDCPEVKVGAVLTGFATNGYKVTNPNAGVWSRSGGGDSTVVPTNNGVTFTQATHVDGTWTFNFASSDDPTVTGSTVVTVGAGATPAPAYTPNGQTVMYSGDTIVFTATRSGSCSGSTGLWSFLNGANSPGNAGGATFSPQRNGSTTVTAPSLISFPDTITLCFQPDEDPNRTDKVCILNLVPGVPARSYLITTANPLPDGTITTDYSPLTLTTAGTPVGPNLFTTTWHTLPAPLVLSSGGILSSSTALVAPPGPTQFTVSVHDSSSPPKWTAKTFTLTLDNGGGNSITSTSPNTGSIAGGTSLAIGGTGFVSGDQIGFIVPDVPGPVYTLATSTVINSGTSITAVTPAFGAAGTVDLGLFRSGSFVAFDSGAFTFTSANFTVASFSPASVVVDSGDTVLNVYGTNFDGSCTIAFTPSWGSMTPQTLSSFVWVSSTQIQGTIASSNFGPTHAGTTARISVTKGSVTLTSGTIFNVVPVNLSFTTTSPLPAGTRSSSYSHTILASGGTGSGYVFTLTGTLPTGLTLASSGLISGTVDPTAVSTTFTVTVTDSASNTKNSPFTINIGGGSLSITTNSPLADASVNAFYDTFIAASGGVPALTFTRVSGTIPIGLTLSTSGELSGTPTSGNSAPSVFNFSVQCVDSSSQTVVKAFALTLNPALSTIVVSSISPTSGPTTGGTPVTITGTGFANGCTVQFGAIGATNVQFISPVSIIATTPATSTASTVSVLVQNPDNGQGILSPGFTYQVLSSPVLAGIDNQDGPFAGGQTVVLSGTNFQGISSIKLGLTLSKAVSATFDPNLNIALGTSPQTATVVTPPGITFGDGSTAVEVNIFVTNASGVGVWPLGENGYTYRPPPIITAVVPNTGPTSGGQTVYVVGKNFFQRGAAKPRVFIGSVEVPASNITLVEQ